MLDPRTLIPSNIIAFVGSITGSKDILDLSENERFALKYLPNDGLVGQGKSTVALPEGLHPPIYVHQFGEHMFNPGGWIYGSSDNTDICDFQIVEGNQTGVSRRHFKLDIDPATRWPRITNLSNNVVTLQPSADARHVTLRRSQSLEIKDSVIIHAAGHQVRLCRPDHSPKCRNEYTRKAERYSADFLQALPKLLSGSSTAVVRYGPGDTVYVNEGGPQSSGSFATVVKVREQTSRMVFAAKIPHYNVRDPAGEARNRWESMVGEFTRMSSLQHVSHPSQVIIVIDIDLANSESVMCCRGDNDLDRQHRAGAAVDDYGMDPSNPSLETARSQRCFSRVQRYLEGVSIHPFQGLHAPRPEACQHPHHFRWRRQDCGLWHG